MRFIGVDPGANFTGVAVLDRHGEFLAHGEFADPVGAWYEIWTWCSVEVVVILEDLIGSGRRDKYISRTLKIVGYLENRCREAGVFVKLVPNQARLANVQNVPSEITGKDEIAAAAHALSARENWNKQHDR